MSPSVFYLACLSLLVFLAGCDTTRSLQELRKAPLSGDSFQLYLAKHYLDFSESEEKQYDWWSSKYFADKGLMAAYGQDVPPEHLENWSLPAAILPELKDAKAKLDAILTPAFKQAEPKRAATLQYSFDCWVEQAEEGWQQADIDACRNQFYRLLDNRGPLALGGSLSSSYLFYFPWDARKIDGKAADELKYIASSLITGNEPYEVVINGHADRSGSDEYNMELSRQRAEFIRNELVGKGVAATRISYFAFGESDPLIPTDDGVREPQNRRVEIFIE